MARLPFACTAPSACSATTVSLFAAEGQGAALSTDQRQPLLLPNLVEDLEDARVQSGVLDPELLGQAAPVDQVVAGLLAAALVGERDLSVREEPTHDVRQLAEAHRVPARVVERMTGSIGQKHASEDLGDVFHVNHEAHEPL